MFHRSRKLFLLHSDSISPCWLSILVEQLFSLLFRQLKITQMAKFHEVIVNYHRFAFVGVWDKMENRWPNLQGQNTGFFQLEQCVLRTQTARNLCYWVEQETFCAVHILRSNTNRFWRLFLSHSHTQHLIHLIKVFWWKQRLSLFLIDQVLLNRILYFFLNLIIISAAEKCQTIPTTISLLLFLFILDSYLSSFSSNVVVVSDNFMCIMLFVFHNIERKSVFQIKYVFFISTFIGLMEYVQYFVVWLNSFFVKKLFDVLNYVLVTFFLLKLAHEYVENHWDNTYQDDKKESWCQNAFINKVTEICLISINRSSRNTNGIGNDDSDP